MIYSDADLIKNRLQEYSQFSQTLRSKILNSLEKKQKELERISTCRPTNSEAVDDCTRSLAMHRMQARSLWPRLITELSLAHPRDVNPHMFNSKVSWYDTHPKHTFSNSEALQPLSAEQKQDMESAFLDRLAEKVPSVGSYISTTRKKTSLLTEDAKDETLIKIAMVEIRREAKANYIETVQQNPLLIFLGPVLQNDPQSPSDSAIQAALIKMKDEVEREIAFIKQGGINSERRILSYRNLANEVLAQNHSLCPAALTAQKAAEDDERSTQFKTSAVLAGASVLTLTTCSTLVLCGAAGAALGALDFKLSMNKERAAFRDGVVDAAIGQASSKISEAAEHRESGGASLAVSAVGALTGGATLLKETTSVTTKAAVRIAKNNRASREVIRARKAGDTSQSSWLPQSAHEMAAYSRQHISEVQTQALRLYDHHSELFPSISSSNLKALRKHDREKVLDFKTLRNKHGYRGIPTELLRDHQNFNSWVFRQSADGKHIEISLNEALELLWGQNPGSLAKGIQAARSHVEERHWASLGRLREHVINTLNRIDGEIMEASMRRLKSPQERVEMRLVEFLADLTARKSNPLTQYEFGREITSTSEFVRKMGKDGLVSKLTGGSKSPTETQAARRLLDRVSIDEIADIANWLEKPSLH